MTRTDEIAEITHAEAIARLGRARLYGVVRTALVDSVLAERRARRSRWRQHAAATIGVLVVLHVWTNLLSGLGLV